MVSAYGLKASQKCITPSVFAVVVELVALALYCPFSLLVAFELPPNSKCSEDHLLF